MAEGKGHRKKKAGRKAEKRKAAESRKRGGADGGGKEVGATGAKAMLSDEQVRCGSHEAVPGCRT